MNKLTFLPAAAMLLLSTVSCKKNSTEVIRDPQKDVEKVQAFFSQHAPKYESFTVDAAAGGVVTTSKGTKVKFPANVFLTLSNQPVTGSITVEVKDILKASEMILGDKPTLDIEGNMLLSFGEFNVKANQNGNALKIKRDSVVVAGPLAPRADNGQAGKIPMWDGDTTVSNTQTGHDHENMTTSITSMIKVGKGVQWKQNGQSAVTNPTNGTSNFMLDALGQWRNCDALVGDARPRTTVLGYFSNHFNSLTGTSYMGIEPSMLFFKAKNQNTLIKLYNKILNAPTGKEGLLSYQNSFTVGMEGTFLAITAKEDKFYAEMKDVTIGTPAAGKTYSAVTFTLQEVSEASLLALINQINSK